MKKKLDRVIRKMFHAEKEVDLKTVLAVAPVAEKRKLILSFGTGRCGMRWIMKTMDTHSNCIASSERFPLEETFFRYVTWNKLPIDLSGFYHLLQQSIYYDWQQAPISYHASPYYCFGMEELLKRFQPDYSFFHLRRADRVTNSMFVKGWYKDPIFYADKNVAAGLQPRLGSAFHRNFGRIMPSGEFLDEWLSLTQVGRIAWYCSTVATTIEKGLSHQQTGEKILIKLEDADQNYDFYQNMANALQLEPHLPKKHFMKTKKYMWNMGKTRRHYSTWTEQEKKEFDIYIEPYVNIYDGAKSTFL